MHNIYENAALNIAGPGAADFSAGFLYERAPPLLPPCTISVTVPDGSWQGDLSFSLMDRVSCTEDGHARMETEGPLAKRAWIVQEQYLSPRTIYFGTAQIYFECASVIEFETLRYPCETLYHWYETLRQDVHFVDDRLKNLDVWYDIVKMYSARKLTVATDRLPGLSGLAARFNATTPDTYLVGLWLSDLHAGLQWRVTDKDCEEYCANAPARPVAPSWSWASCRYGVARLFSPSSIENEPAVEILKACATPAGADPHGEITGSEPAVRGKIKDGIVRYFQGTNTNDITFRIADKRAKMFRLYAGSTSNSEEGDAELAAVLLDEYPGPQCDIDHIPEPLRDGISVHCLLLGHRRFRDGDNDRERSQPSLQRWVALALEPVTSPNRPRDTVIRAYHRIGLIEFHHCGGFSHSLGYPLPASVAEQPSVRDWFCDSETVTVEIV